MNYKLEDGLSVKKNIVSVAEAEVNACIYSLDQLPLHEAIHDIRKRLKKLRALARLFRDEMGEDEYNKINIFYRDLGRELAPIRDLTAHLETIEIIRTRYGNHLYVSFFNSLNKKISQERDVLKNELEEKNFFSEYLPEQLEHAKKKLAIWPVEKDDIKIILPSINRVYDRGRTAMKDAKKEPSKEIFHEWRKRVKYLWYQLRLLEDLWPDLIGTWQDETHELADYLGNDHDLMILNDKLQSDSFQLKDKKQEELAHAIVKEYSDHLRQAALNKGELIYAERPDQFTKRIKKYIKANWN